jgi:hypothetical protein
MVQNVFFIVVYLYSGQISTTVSDKGLQKSINAIHSIMDNNTNVIAAEIIDIEGNSVYSIGE